MKRIHEVIEFEHKGVKVLVKINHLKGEVSLVQNNGRNFNDVKDKNWIFVGRKLEYMAGWQEILDAMKYAIREATKILEEDKLEEEKFKEEMILKMREED